jgi:replication fork protection complex subunit Csm3/Swi3
MAATIANRPAVSALDDFGIDISFDPFADSGGEDKESKKRKNGTGLGIEEEVAVAKKQRIPNVKLDENRLLSDKGIPKLRRKAGELKFKGKGHEVHGNLFCDILASR